MNLDKEEEIRKFLHRREFLGGCAGLAGTSLLSSIMQLKVTNSALAAIPNFRRPNRYKALVCVFLYGGNDSFNMLLPIGLRGDSSDTEFTNYSRARGSLALDRDSLDDTIIDGPGSGQNTRRFAVNPNMPHVRDLYNSGALSFIANIGTLARPIADANEFENISSSRRPRGLFSHNDQQETWQTSLADRASRSGWMGRIADMITDDVNTNANISMNISVERTNIIQTGLQVNPYVVSRDGAVELSRFGGQYRTATERLLSSRYQNVLRRHHRDIRQDAINSAAEYNNLISGVNVNDPDDGEPRFRGRLGEQLELVARNIQARDSFGSSRQTFFVFQDGYDTHNSINSVQPGLLANLSENLAAFNNEIENLGLSDQVTTYTASDFGRTLSPNGRGSDHAWGGNSIVMGGAVRGGRIFGDYPTDLTNLTSRDGRALDVGRGRVLPTTSVDELHAELARWYGVPNDNSLEAILPNIRGFHARGVNAPMPIGFLRGGGATT